MANNLPPEVREALDTIWSVTSVGEIVRAYCERVTAERDALRKKIADAPWFEHSSGVDAALPREVREAIDKNDVAAPYMRLHEWPTIRVELLRLTRENAELRDRAAALESFNVAPFRQQLDAARIYGSMQTQRAERAEAERDALRKRIADAFRSKVITSIPITNKLITAPWSCFVPVGLVGKRVVLVVLVGAGDNE